MAGEPALRPAVRRYALRRLALFPPTLLLVSIVVFVVMRALPGDVTAAILGGEGEALQPEVAASIREELGLDDPLPVQYGRWVWSMVNGELGGSSLETGEPIAAMVARQLPVTLQLAAYSAALAVLVSLPLGVVAARYRGRLPDLLTRLTSVAGGALPGFWVAVLALLLAVMVFGWSPPLVYHHLWERPGEHLEMMAIPVMVLAWGYSAHLTRVTRAGLLDALGADYVRTARSKGLSDAAVVVRHALRTTMIPLITVAGLHLGGLLSGAVILEHIFGIPGMGRGLVGAVAARDYPVVQSLSMLLVALVLVINLLVDFLYSRADPRIPPDV